MQFTSSPLIGVRTMSTANSTVRARHGQKHARVFALLLSGALVACGAEKNTSTPTEPNSAPYMAGRVTAITQSGANFGTVRIEAVPGSTTNGPKAVASVDAVTVVLGRDGKRGDFRTLAAGQWVRVWFDGAILQSYPVQGFANTIKIDSLGITPTNPTSNATPNNR